ncbi:diacylglycerol kinase family lipid kinase [Rossellomorea aquimaris]|uniref:diacylglycerol/lipid kinase family protein n=1 Tax=Rossellomorea aquimaris TaxID=189382 RepID=UPI001CD59E18|nr:diacylglycerol kinase family protein [Rossellomorea aquimaris]MCA1057065.1 diacylglycerol kinase family lipid kinase [Rossellomorea aquimaris]
MTMLYSRILLVCNGKAGKGELEVQLKDVIPPLLDKCDTMTVHKTKDKGDAERICRDTGHEYDLVIIMGGDGTVHEAVNGLASLNSRPKVAILPGGTCNDFARSLNVPMNMRQAVEIITSSEREKDIDIVKAGDRYFSNFWGAGLVSKTSDNIDVGSKSVLGKLSYYISAFQSIQDPQLLNVTVTANGDTIHEEVVMVLAANGRSIGANPLPVDIDLEDGLLDVYLVKKTGFPLMKEFIMLRSTGEVSDPTNDIIHIKAPEVSIRFEDNERVDMDGELYDQGDQTLVVLKHHMRLIVGEKK